MGLRNYSSTAREATLATAVSDVATSLVLMEPPAGFPLPPFTAILGRDTADEEVVFVSDVAGSTLTVERGYDSTAAVPHPVGTTVEHGISAVDLREANAHVNATGDVHGVAGSFADAIGKAESDAIVEANAYTDSTFSAVEPRLDDLELRAGAHTHSEVEGGNIPIDSVTGLNTALGQLAPKDTPTFTGTVTVPNGAVSGAAVNKSQLDLKANLASPTFTGTVTVPNGAAAGHAVNKGQVDAAIAAVDLLASSRVRWGQVVQTTDAWGNLLISFTPAFPSTPRLILITGASANTGGDAGGPWIGDGTGGYSAPSASNFHVRGLPPSAAVRINFLAIQ